MPASHPSPANPGPPSVENPHHGAATKSSSVCCSSPLSLRSKAIPLPARTTTRNEPKANATTKPSSLWPDADPTSCSPCSETAPSTNRGQPTSLQRLDENDRSTPRHCGYQSGKICPHGFWYHYTSRLSHRLLKGKCAVINVTNSNPVTLWRHHIPDIGHKNRQRG